MSCFLYIPALIRPLESRQVTPPHTPPSPGSRAPYVPRDATLTPDEVAHGHWSA